MRSLELLDPRQAAAVIIDLQRGYCDPSSDCAKKLGWDVTVTQKVCVQHLKYLRELRALLPWNRIIFTQMEGSAERYAPNTAYGPGGDHTDEFVPHCVLGTQGHDLHIVNSLPGEMVFPKYHPSIFNNGAFQDYLKEEGISQLIFSGVDVAVNASVITASSLGYECVLISDLVGGPAHKEAEMTACLERTGFYFACVRTSKQVIEQLKQPPRPRETWWIGSRHRETRWIRFPYLPPA